MKAHVYVTLKCGVLYPPGKSIHTGLEVLAFPCISTGVYGFPALRAARIAVEACRSSSMDITFCCFSREDLGLYQGLLGTKG